MQPGGRGLGGWGLGGVALDSRGGLGADRGWGEVGGRIAGEGCGLAAELQAERRARPWWEGPERRQRVAQPLWELLPGLGCFFFFFFLVFFASLRHSHSNTKSEPCL